MHQVSTLVLAWVGPSSIARATAAVETAWPSWGEGGEELLRNFLDGCLHEPSVPRAEITPVLALELLGERGVGGGGRFVREALLRR